MSPEPTWIPLAEIRQVGELWPRHGLDPDRVSEFRELYEEQGWDALPPVEVVPSPDGLILADGWHRLEALGEIGAETVPAVVLEVEGGHRDAASYAYEVALERAARVAMPLTQAEKRDAVLKLIEERPELSDRAIGRLVGVAHTTVSRARRGGATHHSERSDTARFTHPIDAAARALVTASKKIEEAHGIGLVDAVMGRTAADHLARALRRAFGEDALDRARVFRSWWAEAIRKIQEEP